MRNIKGKTVAVLDVSFIALGEHNFRKKALFKVIVLVSLNESFHLLKSLFFIFFWGGVVLLYKDMFKAKLNVV